MMPLVVVVHGQPLNLSGFCVTLSRGVRHFVWFGRVLECRALSLHAQV